MTQKLKAILCKLVHTSPHILCNIPLVQLFYIQFRKLVDSVVRQRAHNPLQQLGPHNPVYKRLDNPAQELFDKPKYKKCPCIDPEYGIGLC